MKFRVLSVQFHLHTIRLFEDFARQENHCVRASLKFKRTFLLLPSFFSTRLFSIDNDRMVTGDIDAANFYDVHNKGSVTTWRELRTDFYNDRESSFIYVS